MKNLFIPYELAVIAKEKGFKDDCIAYFDSDNKIVIMSTITENNSSSLVSAPLYQQIIDWFRDKHNILITILSDKENGGICFNTIIDINTDYSYSLIRKIARDKSEQIKTFFNYYECLNESIEQVFKLI